MAKVKDQEIKLLKEELAKKENQLLAQETALLSMSYIQSQLDAALRKIESFEVWNNVHSVILIFRLYIFRLK